MVTTVSIVGGAYLLVVVYMMVMENSMIYFPTVYPEGDWQEISRQDRVQEVHIDVSDGTKIHGLFVAHEQPRGVVLYFHGNAGNVSGRIRRVRHLHERHRLTVLAIDYRGYGKSEGSPSEDGIIKDAVASTEWLAEKTNKATSDLIFLGRSLGGSVAIDMASRYGARGLIIESTFTSLPDVAAKHYPWLPVKWMMRNRLDSLNKIAGYRGPVLQAHGTADQIVPIDNGKRLHNAIPGPKAFVTFNGGMHNSAHPASYDEEIEKFLDSIE